ncbi:MAG: hypothetical protein ACU0DW_05000 [Shimia sp.]
MIRDEAGRFGMSLIERSSWGQPCLKAPHGTPLRIGRTTDGRLGMLVHCSTTVVARAKTMLPADTEYDNARGIILPDGPWNKAALRAFIRIALTYKAPADA